jgi:sucrose phosphorylase
LAGKNDEENVNKTGEGREINRHNFSLEEIEQSLKQEVVQRLLALIRFRNEYPAFDGEFKVLVSAKDEIKLFWQKNDKHCTLLIDLKTNKSVIEYIDEMGKLAQYIV